MIITNWSNAVAHIDADYFFANCELARNPALRGKPVMVLGKLNSCILAKTPEAKSLGISTAMPVWEARKLCPKGIFLHGDFRYYTLVSRSLMSYLSEWSPVVEIYSVDEAFMDLNGLRGMCRKTYPQIADQIREEVKNRIGITVSVGVSVNKTLAKMACEIHKPDGIKIVSGKSINDFLSGITVSDIPGIGRSRFELLSKYGIRTAAQLANTSQTLIQRWFGKTGLLLWRELRGEVSFPLQKDPPPPKSIARTSSFDKPLEDLRVVQGMAIFHLERANEALVRSGLQVGELSLYLRDKNFYTFLMPHRFENPTGDIFEMLKAISGLMLKIPTNRLWRSSGVVLSRLSPTTGRQLNLFEDPKKLDQSEALNKAKFDLNVRFGRTTLRSGATLFINEKCQPSGNRMEGIMF